MQTFLVARVRKAQLATRTIVKQIAAQDVSDFYAEMNFSWNLETRKSSQEIAPTSASIFYAVRLINS